MSRNRGLGVAATLLTLSLCTAACSGDGNESSTEGELPDGAQPEASESPGPSPGSSMPNMGGVNGPMPDGTMQAPEPDPGGGPPAPAATSPEAMQQPSPSASVPEPTADPGSITAAAPQFARLTRAEFRATINDALATDPDVSEIPVDGRVEVFTSNAAVTPDPVHPYLLGAETIAEGAIPDVLPACGAGAVAECLDAEYRAPLERLYRRAPSDAELAGFQQTIEDLIALGASDVDATRSMLASAILSPDFLFRTSLSSAEGARGRRLVEHASYALWDAPPDAELLALAELPDSDFPLALREQAARVVRDSRAVPVLSRFIGQWLHVDTDERMESDEAFAGSPVYLELTSLVEDALANDVAVTDFVSGTRGFVHSDNAEAYGLEGAPTEGDVGSVDWATGSPRRGLLGQELFAGSTRHPDASRRVIFRGLLVRRSLLCTAIPAPSAELVALAGEVGDRTQDDRCAACHQLLDPIGRAFAVLDPDNDEAAQPAEVLGTGELSGTYATLPELLEAVSASRSFAECFSRHWLSFVLEQPLSEVDRVWAAELADSVQAGASLGRLAEETFAELETQSSQAVPWCEGE